MSALGNITTEIGNTGLSHGNCITHHSTEQTPFRRDRKTVVALKKNLAPWDKKRPLANTT